MKDCSSYANQYVYAKSGGTWSETSNKLFVLAYECPGEDTDTPRDLYKQIAQLAAGFVYADTDGKLTLGQFDQDGTNKVSIGMNEIEYDSCDVADYLLNLYRVEGITGNPEWDYWVYRVGGASTDGVDYRITIEDTMFLRWYALGQKSADVSDTGGTLPMLYGIWYGLGGVKIRPFSCKVHTTKRFRLGQRISLTYRDFHEDAASTYESTVTSIEWTFRGGVTLKCGGEDNRVMADCLRGSKGDRVRREAKIKCRNLEKRMEKLGG